MDHTIMSSANQEPLHNQRENLYEDLSNLESDMVRFELKRERLRKELRQVEDLLGMNVLINAEPSEVVYLDQKPETIRESIRRSEEGGSRPMKMSAGKPVEEHWGNAEGMELHKAIGIFLTGVYVKKNSDYGDAFGKSLDKHGMKAAVVRMEDKLGRLDALTSGTDQQVFDEKLEDTVLDLANYAIMTAMYLIEKSR